jgi:uncharacterized delta-60 repeat protein
MARVEEPVRATTPRPPRLRRSLLALLLACAIAGVLALPVAALAAPAGSLDPSFGTGGIVTGNFGTGMDAYTAVAPASGGQFVAVASNGTQSFIVSRFNADGSLDSNFGIIGTTSIPIPGGTDAHAYGVAVQSDGKIVIAGSAVIGVIGVNRPIVVRLLPGGTLDTGFDGSGAPGNGVIVMSAPSPETAGLFTSVAIAPGGNIELAGSAFDPTASGGGSGEGTLLARLNAADGTFDTSWDGPFVAGNGIFIDNLQGTGYDQAEALLVQPDGETVIADDEPPPTGPEARVVRYTSTGAHDSGFGTSGVAKFDAPAAGQNVFADGLVLQPGGDIVLASNDHTATSDTLFLLGYNPSNGTLDDSFGNHGLGGGSPFQAHGAALAPDGSVVMAGVRGDPAAAAAARLDHLGNVGPPFGDAGDSAGLGLAAGSQANGLFVQPDGNIVLVGTNGAGDAFVARLRGAGVADPVTPTPDLHLVMERFDDFTQGLSGTGYVIIVGNAGDAPTSGTVTLTDTLPVGLTATSMSGAGWSCTLATTTCTRADALASLGNYPAISLRVDVSPTAPATVTNTAVVSGGGEVHTSDDTATDTATVGPSIAVPRDTTAPTITSASLTHKTFRVAKGATAISAAARKSKAPFGTTIRFRLSEAASVSIAIRRSRAGVRVGKPCKLATKTTLAKLSAPLRKSLAKRFKGKALTRQIASHIKHCTVVTTSGTLSRREPAGAASVAFTGRIGKKALPTGSYHAVLTARDAAQNKTATARSLAFAIVA